jgi:hypothetical protein
MTSSYHKVSNYFRLLLFVGYLQYFAVGFVSRIDATVTTRKTKQTTVTTTTTTTSNVVLSALGTTINDETSIGSQSNIKSLSLFSPCKINLFLRILRRRDDGYHDLASLFQAIGFGDTLELRILDEESSTSTDDVFTCNMPGVPVDSTNLVLRALQLMRDRTNRNDVFFQANLIKQVPAQAGLGGGSANAATAMWGANELLGRPATLEQVRFQSTHYCGILNVIFFASLFQILNGPFSPKSSSLQPTTITSL